LVDTKPNKPNKKKQDFQLIPNAAIDISSLCAFLPMFTSSCAQPSESVLARPSLFQVSPVTPLSLSTIPLHSFLVSSWCVLGFLWPAFRDLLSRFFGSTSFFPVLAKIAHLTLHDQTEPISLSFPAVFFVDFFLPTHEQEHPSFPTQISPPGAVYSLVLSLSQASFFFSPWSGCGCGPFIPQDWRCFQPPPGVGFPLTIRRIFSSAQFSLGFPFDADLVFPP